MILTLHGNVPSLKNDKQIAFNRKTNRPFITSSKRYKEWLSENAGKLFTQFAGYRISDYPITVELTFWFDNNRRHDLDNAAAGIMDLLTSEGIIEDDNVKFVNKLIINYGGIDKIKPRVEIKLED